MASVYRNSNRLSPRSSYSLAEMKTFKKMATAIRNVDERDGHAESTASFIDSEFSDNSGRTLKAMRSKNSWKKLRVNAICEKAAKIMEDRRVLVPLPGLP